MQEAAKEASFHGEDTQRIETFNAEDALDQNVDTARQETNNAEQVVVKPVDPNRREVYKSMNPALEKRTSIIQVLEKA